MDERPPINLEPEFVQSQSPEALGDKRFKLRRLTMLGSDVAKWRGRFHEAPLLQEIQIGWSGVNCLPEDIASLRRLRILRVLNVSLMEFPLWLCDMRQLKELIVRGTDITRIPNEVSKLTNLRSLDLGNNLLTRFDADMRRCARLYYLGLTDNPLEELPVKLLPQTFVGLAGTPFRHLIDSFNSQRSDQA